MCECMHLLCFAEEGVDKEEPQEGETDVPSPDPKKVAEASKGKVALASKSEPDV